MSRVHDEVQALGQVELFQTLTDGQLTAIAVTSTPYEYGPGSEIVRKGDVDARVYVILDGEARVELGEGDGESEMLAPGDYFGEMSLLDGEPRTATIVATTPVRVLSIERYNFWSLLRENPDIAEQLLIELCRRVRLARGAGRD